MTSKPQIITVVGATASGKTDLARRLALMHNGEIVSADSRQVYRYLDLGTGKDGELRTNETSSSLTALYPQLRYLDDNIPQWLTDFVDPNETYTVAEYQKAAYEVIDDILSRGKTPIICGGTGLYVTSVIEGYEFSAETERDPNNPRHSDGVGRVKKAPDWGVITYGINVPREELHKRIDQRLIKRLDLGLVQEVRDVMQHHEVTFERLRKLGLEYRFIADYLDGILQYDDMVSQLGFAIHRYARRQLTWFRNHGDVKWIESQNV
jgi:tRNA dimethylallyltransferase